MTEANEDWTVEILAPAPDNRSLWAREVEGIGEERESAANQRGARVFTESVDTIKKNWHQTVQKLTEIGDGIDNGSSEWGVSQIEVGLTLSATGQLLFIAEASAEASVKITLTRRQG